MKNLVPAVKTSTQKTPALTKSGVPKKKPGPKPKIVTKDSSLRTQRLEKLATPDISSVGALAISALDLATAQIHKELANHKPEIHKLNLERGTLIRQLEKVEKEVRWLATLAAHDWHDTTSFKETLAGLRNIFGKGVSSPSLKKPLVNYTLSGSTPVIEFTATILKGTGEVAFTKVVTIKSGTAFKEAVAKYQEKSSIEANLRRIASRVRELTPTEETIASLIRARVALLVEADINPQSRPVFAG